MVRMGELAASAVAGDVLVSLGLGSCIGLALVDRAGRRRRARPRRAARSRRARDAGTRASSPTTPCPSCSTASSPLGARAAAARGRARRRRQHVRRARRRPRGRPAQRGRRARAARAAAHPRRRRRDRRRPRPHRSASTSATRRVTVREAGGTGADARAPRARWRWRHERTRSSSADAIAALVDAAQEGRLPEETPAPQRRQRACARSTSRARRSSPPSRSAASSARWRRSAAPPSTRLSAELRVPLELEVINVTQLTWANAHAAGAGELDRPRSSSVEPIGTRMLLLAESSARAGRDRAAARRRRSTAASRSAGMTDIDWALGRHFFERLLAQLSLIWTDVAGLELDAARRRPAHGDGADGRRCPSRRCRFTIEARLERRLGDARAADPVVGDRAGGRPASPPATTPAPARGEDDGRRRCAAPSAASR